MTTEREFQTARRDYERQCAEVGTPVMRAPARNIQRQARALILVGVVLGLFIVAVLARAVWRWA